jgi:hypothetical protein
MSIREVGRAMPASGPIGDLAATIAAGAADDLVNDEAALAKHLERQQHLANTAEEAIEKVLAASPKNRVIRMIRWAVEYLGLDANAEQLRYLETRIQTFAREVADCFDRSDFSSGFNRVLSDFHYAVLDASKIGPPRPPLMPPGDMVFYLAGWSAKETGQLRVVLLKPLCGVQKGDRCVSVDRYSATLASGRRLTKAEIIAANTPAPHPGSLSPEELGCESLFFPKGRGTVAQ